MANHIMYTDSKYRTLPQKQHKLVRSQKQKSLEATKIQNGILL